MYRHSKFCDRFKQSLLLTLLLSAISPQAANAFAMYYITDLGVLDGQGSRALSINEQEQVAGTLYLNNQNPNAFLWQNNQMQNLGTLGGTRSEALHINDQGQIAGWTMLTDSSQQAFIWSNNQMINLGTFGGLNSGAWGLNNLGYVVGNAQTADGVDNAFLWNQTELINLGTLGGTASSALAINNAGQIAGWAATPTSNGWGNPVLWSSDGQISSLGLLPNDVWGQGNGINDNGQVVGVSVNSDQDRRAVLWQEGQMVALPDLGGRWGEPRAINNKGQIVGWSETTTSASEQFNAVIWEDGQVANLNGLIRPNSGWLLQEAWDINEKGQIIGHGIYAPPGQTPQRRAFLLSESCRISPEQQNLRMPDSITNEGFQFDNVPTDLWYDPPATMGFTYQTSGDSLFTSILNFPCGVDPDNTFSVSVGDLFLGEFKAGQSVNFVDLLGSGVSQFTVYDINAEIDPQNPVAFPIQLGFSTPTASFSMKPVENAASVPEPSTLIGSGVVGLMVGWRKWRDRFTKSSQ